MLHSQHNLMELNEAITTAAAMDAIEHGGGGSFDSNSPRRHSVMTTTGTAFGGMAADGGELTQQELVKGNLFHRRWFNRLLRFGPEAQYQYQCSEFELKEQDRLRAIDDRRNYRLETGIIDYCLVLGESNDCAIFLGQLESQVLSLPTHCIPLTICLSLVSLYTSSTLPLPPKPQGATVAVVLGWARRVLGCSVEALT